MTESKLIPRLFVSVVLMLSVPSVLTAGGHDCEIIKLRSPSHVWVKSAESAYESDSVAVIARVVIDSSDSRVHFSGHSRTPFVDTTYTTTVKEIFKTDQSQLKAGDRFDFNETAGRAKHAGCWYVMETFPETLVTGDEYLVFAVTTGTRTHYSVSPWDSYAIKEDELLGRLEDIRGHDLEEDALGILRTLAEKSGVGRQ